MPLNRDPKKKKNLDQTTVNNANVNIRVTRLSRFPWILQDKGHHRHTMIIMYASSHNQVIISPKSISYGIKLLITQTLAFQGNYLYYGWQNMFHIVCGIKLKFNSYSEMLLFTRPLSSDINKAFITLLRTFCVLSHIS